MKKFKSSREKFCVNSCAMPRARRKKKTTTTKTKATTTLVNVAANKYSATASKPLARTHT